MRCIEGALELGLNVFYGKTIMNFSQLEKCGNLPRYSCPYNVGAWGVPEGEFEVIAFSCKVKHHISRVKPPLSPIH